MSKLTGVSRQRDDYDTSVPARRRGSNHSDHESYESPTAPREDHLLLESAARLGHGDADATRSGSASRARHGLATDSRERRSGAPLKVLVIRDLGWVALADRRNQAYRPLSDRFGS
jgi:hypothetical protein